MSTQLSPVVKLLMQSLDSNAGPPGSSTSNRLDVSTLHASQEAIRNVTNAFATTAQSPERRLSPKLSPINLTPKLVNRAQKKRTSIALQSLFGNSPSKHQSATTSNEENRPYATYTSAPASDKSEVFSINNGWQGESFPINYPSPPDSHTPRPIPDLETLDWLDGSRDESRDESKMEEDNGVPSQIKPPPTPCVRKRRKTESPFLASVRAKIAEQQASFGAPFEVREKFLLFRNGQKVFKIAKPESIEDHETWVVEDTAYTLYRYAQNRSTDYLKDHFIILDNFEPYVNFIQQMKQDKRNEKMIIADLINLVKNEPTLWYQVMDYIPGKFPDQMNEESMHLWVQLKNLFQYSEKADIKNDIRRGNVLVSEDRKRVVLIDPNPNEPDAYGFDICKDDLVKTFAHKGTPAYDFLME